MSQECHGIERDYCAILKSYYRQPDEDRVLVSAVSSDQQSALFLFFRVSANIYEASSCFRGQRLLF